MKNLFVIGILLCSAAAASGQECYKTAKEIMPTLPQEVRLKYSENLEIAGMNYVKNPGAETVIWYARRKGYLGYYKDAIEALTIAIEKHSLQNNAAIYRHRGHRFISLRCFDDAVKDLEKAASLIKGEPDLVEQDGLPNAKNVPTSTLQSNIWYHLGLAYYLKNDLKNAERAYKECQKVSKNNDMRVATTYWRYMTLRRAGKKKQAENLLKGFDTNIEVIENDDYLKLLKLNKGESTADDLLGSIKGDAATLGQASLGYGIGNYYFYNGNKTKAKEIFERVVAGDQWASFGYIAAENDLLAVDL